MTPADLQRLQSASGRFIKLPDAGWLELDATSVQSAHEAMADLGVDGLIPVPQRLNLAQAAHLDEAGLQTFGDTPQAKMLRQSLSELFPPRRCRRALWRNCVPISGRDLIFFAI